MVLRPVEEVRVGQDTLKRFRVGVGDDIVIIAQGRVVAQGTPERILAALGTTDLEEAFVRAAAAAEPQT